MTKESVDPIEMARIEYEKKRERNREVRENNKKTARSPLPSVLMMSEMHKTYRAGQLWASGIVGLLGGLIIALLLIRC